jgi:hypothetical protein
MTLVYLLALVGSVVSIKRLRNIYKLLFEDREGNSGRYKHWSEG